MKKSLALFLALFVIPVVSYSQATLAYDLFMARVTGWTAGTVGFSTTGAVLSSAGTPVYAASTVVGGGTSIATAARVAVGGTTAAVAVTGGVTAAEVFAGVRTVVMGGSGVGLLALTAFSMAPMVVNYFKTDDTRLGPLDRRNSDKPFELAQRAGGMTCQAPNPCVKYQFSGRPVFNTKLGACNDYASSSGAGVTGLIYSDEPNVCYRYLPNGGSMGGTGIPGILVYDQPSDSLEWVPAGWDDIKRYMDAPTKVVPPEQFRALLDAGLRVDVTPKVITGPAEVIGPERKTVVETPEKITTTTTTPKTKLEYKEKLDPNTGKPVPFVQATPREETVVRERDKATGNEREVSTTVITAPKAPDPEKTITCGLPDTPKCAIEEKGTPEPKDFEEKKAVDDLFKPLKDFATDPKSKLPELPSLNWAFSLPSGCTAIKLPAFEPYLQNIDICQFLPMFHDVMGIVWIIGGLFGAIGMFWRNTFSQN